MTITDEDVQRFRGLWKDEFAEEITEDEARLHIGRLDTLYLLLARKRSTSEIADEPEASTNQ